jgi:ABC-type phosphate/phosphonate transport system substrate-binding protein
MSLFRSLLVLGAAALTGAAAPTQEKAALTVVVMDPLAAELSCPCVKGYAQRDYNLLGKHLVKQLGRPVQVFYGESLGSAALLKKTGGKADIVIGKESVIRHDGKAAGHKLTPLLSLTGKDGKTTQTGLIVVADGDKALTTEDLGGYKILFGPAVADEKHSAALALLRESKVTPPKELETCNSCSDGATKILELHRGGVKAACVISSYAQPLLEGCGTIKKGELRVVGETDPVPFVVVFVNDTVPAADRSAVAQAFGQVAADSKLCTALETKRGFVPFDGAKKK